MLFCEHCKRTISDNEEFYKTVKNTCDFNREMNCKIF